MFILFVPQQSYHCLYNKKIVSLEMFAERAEEVSAGSDIEKIVTNLYIGDEGASNNQELLEDLGVKHIVMVGKELKKFFPDHFNYLEILVRDYHREDISQFFNCSFQFIESALSQKHAVLVHCRMGKSRSATIIIAYLMRKYKLGFQEAFSFIKRKRKNASPNQGFLTQLKNFEESLKNKPTSQNQN